MHFFRFSYLYCQNEFIQVMSGENMKAGRSMDQQTLMERELQWLKISC